MFVLIDENGNSIASSDDVIRYVNGQAVLGYKKPIYYSQFNESNSSIVERDHFDLDDLKAKSRNKINAHYYALINSPVEYKGVYYRGGEMSLLSINGVLSRALRDNTEPKLIRDIDDNLISLTIAELEELTALIFDTIKPLDEAMGNARVAIRNAETVGEIQSILEGLEND